LWSSGRIQDLGALSNKSNFTRARAINVRGEVVGASSAEHQSRAFIWSPGRGMRDLNEVVPEPFAYLLSDAVAINNRGQIVAVGQGPDYRHDTEGRAGPSLHVFILTPDGSGTPALPRGKRISTRIGSDFCGLSLPVASAATMFQPFPSTHESVALML
jgi:probable HAF family extracellular repeat protein